MARRYANIFTAIWRDEDFRALPAGPQLAYLKLITQSDISSCGALSMTFQRWANQTAGMDVDSLSNDIQVLTDRRYVVEDSATEELLIRSFARWDGGINVPKRKMAVVAAAEAIASNALRQVMAHELERLGVDHQIQLKDIDSLSNAYREDIDSPRVVVTLGSKYQTHNPETGNHNREPEPTTAADAPAPKSNRGHRIPDDFDVTESMRSWADKAVPGMDIQFHTQKFRNHWEATPGTKALKLDWVKTWQNWLMNDYRPQRQSARNTTDDKVQATLEMGRRLAEQEQRDERLGIAQ